MIQIFVVLLWLTSQFINSQTRIQCDFIYTFVFKLQWTEDKCAWPLFIRHSSRKANTSICFVFITETVTQFNYWMFTSSTLPVILEMHIVYRSSLIKENVLRSHLMFVNFVRSHLREFVKFVEVEKKEYQGGWLESFVWEKSGQ